MKKLTLADLSTGYNYEDVEVPVYPTPVEIDGKPRFLVVMGSKCPEAVDITPFITDNYDDYPAVETTGDWKAEFLKDLALLGPVFISATIECDLGRDGCEVSRVLVGDREHGFENITRAFSENDLYQIGDHLYDALIDGAEADAAEMAFDAIQQGD